MNLFYLFFIAMLRRWFVEDKGDTYAYQWENNEAVVEWMEEQKKNVDSLVNRNINAVRKDAIVSRIKESLEVRKQLLSSIHHRSLIHFLSRNVPMLLLMLLLDCVKLSCQHKEAKLFVHWHS